MKLTRDIAYAAGADAANRNMRANGRTTWSREDYNVACKETNRLFDLIEPEEYLSIRQAANNGEGGKR